MKHNFQPRLNLYYNLIGKFDTVDKYCILQVKAINNLSVLISWNLLQSTKNSLNILVFKEFFTYKRFNCKKHFFNSFFHVTLRNNSMFLYLEMLINSYLLVNNISFKSNYLNKGIFLNNLNLPNQNKFFKVTYQNVLLKNCFNFTKFKNKLNQNFLRCYFLN